MIIDGFVSLNESEHPSTRTSHGVDSEGSYSAFSQAESDISFAADSSEQQGLPKRRRPMSPGHLGSQHRPFKNTSPRSTELKRNNTDYRNGPQLNRAARIVHMNQSSISDVVQLDTYAAGSQISNSEGQTCEPRYQSFCVEPPQAGDNFLIYPKTTTINRSKDLLHSR